MPSIPPTTLQAERAVLAGLLRRESAFSTVIGTLQTGMFADPVHAAVFERILSYDQRDRDPALLIEDIRTSTSDPLLDVLADVDGLDYLVDVREVLDPALERAAVFIRESWRLRRLIDLGERLRDLAHDVVNETFSGLSADEMTQRLQVALQDELLDLAALTGSAVPTARTE